jgi:hypothetical protein
VCALDAVDAVLEEYEVAACSISSSRSVEIEFVDDEPVVAAVAVVLGAWAANHAPRPRNDAALTAPVMRRARRAGCGFLVVLMCGACAHPRKTT